MRPWMVYVVALAIALPIAIALRDPLEAMVAQWGWPHYTVRLISIGGIAIFMASVEAMTKKLGWVREKSDVSQGTPQ
jgi:hypothetical protein